VLAFDHGDLVIDQAAREVRLDGTEVALTRSEFDLLLALASTPGKAFSRAELVARVHGYDYEGYERTIDVHVKNLRAKLGDDPKAPRWILTVPGVGYRFGMRPDG
jgi:DNA-binding response OmpR family regulator